MKFTKKLTYLAVFTSLVLTFACGNNTSDPESDADASSSTAGTVVSGLTFTGLADGADLSVTIADNYLAKVFKGNPYDTEPYTSLLTCDATFARSEIKISNFTYYGSKVDILCKKDPELGLPANELTLLPMGSNPNGDFGYFPLCSNGLYYFMKLPFIFPIPTPVAQGPHHEITMLDVRDDTVFVCEGSDNKEYEVTVYNSFVDGGLTIDSVFDTDARTFKGVMSVNLKNYNDQKIDIFFE